jgi:hypothetical protein
MTEILNGMLRAVRQPTAAKMVTGFELGKLLSQNELQRSACQETSPQLHNSAARHRLREFGRKKP